MDDNDWQKLLTNAIDNLTIETSSDFADETVHSLTVDPMEIKRYDTVWVSTYEKWGIVLDVFESSGEKFFTVRVDEIGTSTYKNDELVICPI